MIAEEPRTQKIECQSPLTPELAQGLAERLNIIISSLGIFNIGAATHKKS